MLGRTVFLRKTWARAILCTAVLAATITAGADAKGGPNSQASKVLASVEKATNFIHVYSHELGEDEKLVEGACADARLSRQDQDFPDKLAYLKRAANLVEDGLGRDFEPAVKSGGDYLRLEHQIDSLAATTSGLRRHRLLQSSLVLEKARMERSHEVSEVHKYLDGALTLDCENAHQNGAFASQRFSEADEKDAIDDLRFALRTKAGGLRSSRPLQFRISVTYTVTYIHSELDNNGPCQVQGSENGSLTETAVFPPITVLPSGQIKQVLQANGDLTMNGTWTASGYFYPENDCSVSPMNYSCGGPLQQSSETIPAPSMAIAPEGDLAGLAVQLPQVQEASTDSCPDQGVWDAAIPPQLAFPSVSNYGAEFAVPLDGIALRQRFDPATIEDGILHLGPALPPNDCASIDTSLYVTCSNAGSTVKDVVTVEPLATD